MNLTQSEYLSVARIGSSYGVHGWVKIRPYAECNINLLDYNPWYLSKGPGTWEAVEIENGRYFGETLIVKLKPIQTPEEAKLYTGRIIALLKTQLPPLKEDEYYWSDLIGLTVINKKGETLGKVIYLMATGSNDVLVIKNDKEHAIPYLFGEVVLEINLQKQQILVDWELF